MDNQTPTSTQHLRRRGGENITSSSTMLTHEQLHERLNEINSALRFTSLGKRRIIPVGVLVSTFTIFLGLCFVLSGKADRSTYILGLGTPSVMLVYFLCFLLPVAIIRETYLHSEARRVEGQIARLNNTAAAPSIDGPALTP